MGARHLRFYQRVELEFMYKKKFSRSQMAKELGCSPRTVFYELKRGYYERLDYRTYKLLPAYSAEIAQNRYNEMQGHKARPIKLGKSWEFVRYVEQRISKDKFSPRAILAEIQTKGLDFGFTVSPATLYSWVEKGYLNISYTNLPEGRHKRRAVSSRQKANYSHPGHSIEHRPKAVYQREDIGHWEMDTVIGKQSGRQKCLLVLTERKTGMELVRLMRSKTAAETVRCLDEIERAFKGSFPQIFKTITVDNGTEFADWRAMERNGRTKVYYCHPYSSWERGRNERANRLIRRFCPKGQSLNRCTHKYIRGIQDWMNDYPRQSLGWRTPRQVFIQECAALNISIPCTL